MRQSPPPPRARAIARAVHRDPSVPLWAVALLAAATLAAGLVPLLH